MNILYIYTIVLLFPLLTASQQTAYITDLVAYTALAPCAYSGLSMAVQQLTSSQCLTPPPAQATCACTQYSDLVHADITSYVAESCGSAASEDWSSAGTVFEVYCADSFKTTFAGDENVVAQWNRIH
jgi:hypothetical protein